jgi:hypothetical protein
VIDLDANDASAVHVAPGVELAVVVGIVLEEGQATCVAVVDRLDVSSNLRLAATY